MNRDEILALSDIKTEDVPVPEWNTTLKVRSLTGAERDEFEQSRLKWKGNKVERNLANTRAKLVALSVVNEDGTRMFKDDDTSTLGRKNAAALDRLFDVAQRLSGFTKADIEELTKNSDADQKDTSTSN